MASSVCEIKEKVVPRYTGFGLQTSGFWPEAWSLQPEAIMKIGCISLESPYVIAPMAGMTDSAFRRLVKRHGGCGLVVTEMVSSEGLVRGIDRTLE